MIKYEDLVKIGKLKKPHGVKGEVSFTFTNESFESDECPFLILEMDGIYVPFKLEEVRFVSDATAFVNFKNVDSDTKARLFTNKDVYFPRKYFKEDEESESYTWTFFIGFTLVDETQGEVGVISDIDDSTINTLFLVERGSEEIMIPAIDDLITHVDEEGKKIYLNLPEGLLDL